MSQPTLDGVGQPPPTPASPGAPQIRHLGDPLPWPRAGETVMPSRGAPGVEDVGASDIIELPLSKIVH